MRVLTCLVVVSLVASTGCNVQTGVSPLETVITKCSERDFGLVGTWIPSGNRNLQHDVDTYRMTIARDDSYTATLHDGNDQNESQLKVQFRTFEVSKDHPHAIVEIELMNDDKIAYRRLAIAAVQLDDLYLWMIDGRKIGKHLYNDEHVAVIEHFTFSTTIRCDPQELLETIRKHSNDIVGDAQVFQRESKIGK